MKYLVRKGFVYVVSPRERYQAGDIVEVAEPFKKRPHQLVEVPESEGIKSAKTGEVTGTQKTTGTKPAAKKTRKKTTSKTTSRRRKTTKKVTDGE